MCTAEETGSLIRRAAGGDRAALERLLLDHYGPLAAKIGRRLPPSLQSVVDVDDVVQQTYAKVFQRLGQFELREDATFLSWLLAIAENQLRDAVRAQQRKKRGGGQAQVRCSSANEQSRDADLLEILIGPAHTASRSMARREGIEAIRVALAGLPEDYRRAIELRYYEGYTIEEAAALMGRTTGAIRGLIDRARKQLRESLGRASRYLSEK